MRLRCLIVDDEPLARRVLEKYILSLPFLELAGECSNALEAAAFLHDRKVDVLFLDIKMPELSGLDFLKTLPDPPNVILTTAHSEYALEGYEYSVIDYLLKPIPFERFLKAVNKVKIQDTTPNGHSQPDAEFILLRENKIDHRVRFSEIRYVEGCGNFVKVVMKNKTLLVAETMSGITERLPERQFVRTHKSFIVSLKHIEKIAGDMLRLQDVIIPIGRTYRREVEKRLEPYRK